MAQQNTISRRRFVQTTAAGSLALAGMGLGRPTWAQSTKPNIVFIMADDLGYADVSCYGQRDYTTPNIDRLAIEGMRFTQGYANSPVCSATRVALITGRYQYRLPVGLEEPIDPTSPQECRPAAEPPDLAVTAEEGGLRHRAGRQMASRLPAGFQSVEERLRPLLRNLRRRCRLFQSWCERTAQYQFGPDVRRQLHEQEVPVERHGYMTNLLGDRAVQTVEGYARSREPFLLSLHFTAPHWPWEGPDDEAEAEAHQGLLAPRRRHRRRPMPRWCRAWTPISAASAGARRAAVSQATPSSSSPATTAASGSPILGRSPA